MKASTLMLEKEPLNIAVIGGGWYGCHLALALKEAGHRVTLFEKNKEIFSQISGSFGIRLHSGLHYPRSEQTRQSCQRTFNAFQDRYPELVIPHEHSIYGVGDYDANGDPSRVSSEDFTAICQESTMVKDIDPHSLGYQHLVRAVDIEEPSIMLGTGLRDTFTQYLNRANIPVICNYEVTFIHKTADRLFLGNEHSSYAFDKIINATSYQSLLAKTDNLPVDIEVKYQPCLALMYEDQTPGKHPFSFIVIDGFFPCMMPVITEKEHKAYTKTYILTHAKWTILGSFDTPEEANKALHALSDEQVLREIKKPAAQEMKRFWPAFEKRFKYVGWKGGVLAKLRTQADFRSAFTYEKEGVIYVFPGKVSNIFDVEQEVLALLSNQHLIKNVHYKYMQDGVLDLAAHEMRQRPIPNRANIYDIHLLKQQQQDLINTNYYFKLQCFAGLLTGFSILIGALLILPALAGLLTTTLVSSVALMSIGYCTYGLFATSPHKGKKIPSQPIVEGLHPEIHVEEAHEQQILEIPPFTEKQHLPFYISPLFMASPS